MIRYIVLGDYRVCRDWLLDHGIGDREAVVLYEGSRTDRLVGLAGPVEVVRLHNYHGWSWQRHAEVERRIRIINSKAVADG